MPLKIINGKKLISGEASWNIIRYIVTGDVDIYSSDFVVLSVI